MPMSLNDAITAVSFATSSTTYPVLTTDDVTTLVQNAQRWTPWVASFAYSWGTVVIPTVRNGHVYRCISAGTSAAVEPTWPLYTSPDRRPGLTRPHWHGWTGPMPSSEVSDGTAVWIETGPDHDGNQWDVQLAIHKAWRLKASRAAADYNVTVDQNTYNREQVIKHCMDQARLAMPARIV